MREEGRCRQWKAYNVTDDRVVMARCKNMATHGVRLNGGPVLCCDCWECLRPDRLSLLEEPEDHAAHADDPGVSPGSPETAAPRPRE